MEHPGRKVWLQRISLLTEASVKRTKSLRGPSKDKQEEVSRDAAELIIDGTETVITF